MISIIVPVYNVASYLSTCIDSILKQSYADWELILIDDGSTDQSGILCDTYANKNSRISSYHLPNGGVSRARNVGISHAKGEWITFIDGDDWISEDFLAHLFEPISQTPTLDLVHGGCLNYSEKGKVTVNQQYERYLGSDSLYILTHFRGLAVSKLFKKGIIDKHHILFDNQVAIGEDYLFTLDYLPYVQEYCLIESTGYYYRCRPSSATQSKQKVPYKVGVHQMEHNIASLNQYLKARSLSDDQASMRWKDISNNLFFLIRSNGWWNIGKDEKLRIHKALRNHPLIELQPLMKRKVYLWAFRLYCSL